MFEMREIKPSEIEAVTDGVGADELFDFDAVAARCKSSDLILGHFDKGQPFGFTKIRPSLVQGGVSVSIEVVWNKPSFRGMGLTSDIVGKLCDVLSERFVTDNGIEITGEAASKGGMRFCKDVIYEMSLRGVRVRGAIIDLNEEMDATAAEHGDFEIEFPGDEPNGERARTDMAIFLLEQTRRDVWVPSFSAKFVRTAIRAVCSAHLKGELPDETHLDEMTGEAIESSIRSQREGEFCRMAASLVVAKDAEMTLSPR